MKIKRVFSSTCLDTKGHALGRRAPDWAGASGRRGPGGARAGLRGRALVGGAGVAVGLAVLLVATAASAATLTWSAARPGSWSNSINWTVTSGTDGDGVPDSDDIVVFNATSQQPSTIDQAFTIQRLQIGVGYTGLVSLGTNTLDISAELTTDSAITLDAQSGLVRAVGTSVFNTAASVGEFEITGGGDATFTQDLNINGDLRLTSVFRLFGPGRLKVTGNVIAADANSNGSTAFVRLEGAGNQTLFGPGTFHLMDVGKSGGSLSIDNTFVQSFQQVTVTNGTWNVNGVTITSGTFRVNAAGILTGAGTLNGPLTNASGGTIVPPNLPANLTLNGNLVLNTGSTWQVNVPSADPGDQTLMTVNGTVNLGTATLTGTSGAPPNGNIPLILNDGVDATASTFLNLSGGSIFQLGGRTYTIVYNGGTGNDVVLGQPIPLNLVALNPDRNDMGVALGANITATFDANINGATLLGRVKARGSLSGDIALSTSISGAVVTLNPTDDLQVGERVTVTFLSGIRGTGAEILLNPIQFQFFADVPLVSGNFQLSGQALGAANSLGVALGDLDGDGDLDAFVANESNQPNEVWLNNGAGTFTDSGQALGARNSQSVALGDLDGDGDLDAFVANLEQPSDVWLNNGAGVFTDSGQNIGNNASRGVALGDMDGDGDLDAFVANDSQADKLWLNSGAGVFTDSGQNIGGTRRSADVALGDVDNDGDLDAMTSNFNGGDSVYLNNGAGVLTDSRQSLSNPFSQGVELGDVDGDGDLDAWTVNAATNPDKVFLNNGNGVMTDSGQSLGTFSGNKVRFGDLDGDDDLDAFVINISGGNRFFTNNGTGTLTLAVTALGNATSRNGALGDLNGDGSLDVFIANSSGQPNNVVFGVQDRDGDGIVDGNDNCPDNVNVNQANADGDLFGDVCDPAYTVSIVAETGVGSFLAGITFTNANPGADTIEFAIPGNGPHTVALGAQERILTGPTTIDGTTQPGFVNVPVIILNSTVVTDALRLNLDADDSTLKALKIVNGGTPLRLDGPSNVTIDNLDLTREVNGCSFIGLFATGSNNLIVRNSKANNRSVAIAIESSTGATVTGNDLLATCTEAMRFNAVNNIRASSNLIDNNQVRALNTTGLVVANNAAATSPDHHIQLEDNNTENLNLRFDNVDNAIVENLDMSRAINGCSGGGLFAVGSDNLIVRNSKANNRSVAIAIESSTGATVTGNDLLTTCNEAMRFNTVGGIKASNNLIDNNQVRALNTTGLVVGNNAATTSPNNHIQLEDNNTENLNLRLDTVSNTTVENLTLSHSLGGRSGTGLLLSGCNNTTVRTLLIENRETGLNASGGAGLAISCTTIRNSAFGFSIGGTANTSILNARLSGNTTALFANGAVDAQNTFWGATNGPSNLGGNGNGFSGAGPIDADPFLALPPPCAPLFDDADNDAVDAEFDNCPDDANANQADADGDLLGDVCDPAYTVTTVATTGVGSLPAGITFANTNPGADAIDFAIPGNGPHTINLVAAALSITGPTTIDGTTQPGFTTTPVIVIQTTAGTAISLSSGAANSALKALKIVDDGGTALSIAAAGVVVDNVDGSKTVTCTFGGSGVGLQLTSSSNVIVRNSSFANRGNGVAINGGDNVILTATSLNGSGCSNVGSSLSVTNTTQFQGSALTWTGARTTRLTGLTNFTIIDAVPQNNTHHLIIDANSGFGAALDGLLLANMTGTSIRNVNLSFGGVSRTGNGLGMSNPIGAIITGVLVQKRGIGISIAGGSNVAINCTTIQDTTVGVSVNSTTGSSLANVRFASNTTALSSNVAIDAQNTFWGATNGPSNLGGNGNSFNGAGPIDADPFLAFPPPCAPLFVDGDNDTIDTAFDNCPVDANANQANIDGDVRGDVCDNCPETANNNQADADQDGVGDACEMTLTARNPARNALDVALDGIVRLTFSEPIAIGTVQAGIRLRSEKVGDLAFTADIGEQVLFLTPTSAFLPGDTITVSVLTALRSVSNRRLDAPEHHAFVAEAPEGFANFADSGQRLGNVFTLEPTLGDLDGDGDLDMFEINTEGTPPRVLFNDGQGAMVDGGQVININNPHVALLGDVDADGDLDAFIVLKRAADKLLLNNGSGVFTDSGQVFNNRDGIGGALSDLDGDGDLDIFVTNLDAPNEVFFNNGVGVFTDSGQRLGDQGHSSIALGDLDGDGDLDAFVSKRTPEGEGEAADRVFLNNGAGIFTDSGQRIRSDNTHAVLLGDLDGDGDLDAFLGIRDAANRVLLNNGAGVFSDSGQALGNSPTSRLAIGDVDSDGDLDVFAANNADPSTLFLNNGAGIFTDSGVVFNINGHGAAMGDLNGDGTLDLVVTNEGPNEVWFNQALPLEIVALDPDRNAVDVAPNTTMKVTFAAALDPESINGGSVAVAGSLSGRLAVDLSVNGAELNITLSNADLQAGERVSVVLKPGIRALNRAELFVGHQWQFITQTPDSLDVLFDTGQRHGVQLSFDVDLGDFDQDGDLDALVARLANNVGNRLFVNDGEGNLQDAGLNIGTTTALTQRLAVGDLDGDGDLDVFTANDGSPDEVWFAIDGEIGFEFVDSGQRLGGGLRSVDVQLGDMDGDGDLDAVVASLDGTCRLFVNDGSGGFDVSRDLGVLASGLDLGDIDSDGDLDVYFAVGGGVANRIFVNDGRGLLTDSGQALGNTSSSLVKFADADADGDVDAFVANASANNDLWLNNGAGVFSDSGQSLGGGSSFGVAVVDIEADGDIDALFPGFDVPNRIFTSDNGDFQDAGPAVGGLPSNNGAFGDLNSDGKMDLVLTRESLTVHLGNTNPTLEVNGGLTVNEGASATIDAGRLRVQDDAQESGALVFTLATAPTNGILRNNGATIAQGGTFTQANIAANLITYLHNGSETTSDLFRFTVSDGVGGSIGNTAFNIAVTPVNDAPVLATNAGLTVAEGASGTIGAARLQVTDADNTAAQIVFTLATVPTNGILRNNGATIAQGGTFTQANVAANLITYLHNGSETTSDLFRFTVSDGVGGSIGNTAFNITVTPVNDVPVIVALTGDATGNEGDSLDFDAVVSDEDGDALTLTWTFSDDNSVQTGVGLTSVSQVYDDNGNFTVTLSVSDGQVSVERVFNVTIANLAPQNVSAGNDASINEGDTLSLSGSGDDPGNDTLTFCWDFGDGSAEQCGVNLTDLDHRFEDNGQFTVRLRVSDEDGGQTSDTLTVTVANVSPTADAGQNLTAREGELITFDGTLTDPSPIDEAALQFEWNFGDGSRNSQDVDPQHAFANEGVFEVELSVLDKDGGFGTDSIQVTVTNVAPTVDIGQAVTVAEGQAHTFVATVVDPGVDDRLEYTWQLGDGTRRTGRDLTEVTHTYTRPGQLTLRLSVNDGTTTTTATINVTVTNVQPVVQTLVFPQVGDEGQQLAFRAVATEPGRDDPNGLTYTWDFGDNTILANTGPVEVFHTYRDEGVFTARVTIADGEGAALVVQRSVTISNLAPVVDAGEDVIVEEGEPFTFEGSAVDPGAGDVLTYCWDFGDGSEEQCGVGLNDLEHTFVDNGDFTATLTATDDSGAFGVDTVEVEVLNVAPTVALGGDRTVAQGVALTFVSSVTDPGQSEANDEELQYAWSVTCDRNRFPGCDQAFEFTGDFEGEDLEEVVLTFNRSRDLAGLYTLTLRVEDKDGGVGTDAIEINVDNEAPIVTLALAENVIDEGTAAQVSVTAQDPGGDDLVVDLDFGDGQVEAGIAHAAPYPTISRSHVFANDGQFVVSVVATDADDAQGSASAALRVRNLPPVVSMEDFQGQEGVELALSATASDVQADTLRFTWSFGDGTTAVTAEPTVRHTYGRNGSFVLRLSVFDGTDTTTVTSTVTIDNEAPVVSLDDVEGFEGVAVALTAQAVDIGGDALSFSWDFGDGSEPVVTQEPSVSHVFPDNGVFIVTLQVRDGVALTEVVATATIANVAPTVEDIDDVVQPEGQTLTVFAEALDVEADTLTFCWDFGDGSEEQCGVDLSQVDHDYDDDATRTVTVSVSDEDGGQTLVEFEVRFTNVAPGVDAGDNIVGQLEGTAVAFDAQGSDAGSDALTFCWTFGDGSEELCGEGLSAPEHVYNEQGVYLVRLVAIDDEGARSNRDSLRVTVLNVAPVVVLGQVPGQVDEGEPFTVTATATDPGFDRVTFCWRTRQGGPEICREPVQDITGDTYEDTFEVVYDDNGTFELSVRAVDDDFGQGRDSATIEVLNVAPSIVCEPPLLAFTGQEYVFDVEVIEPGADDVLTFELVEGHPGAQIDSQGRVSFVPEEFSGTFDFELAVSDDDGGQDTCTWQVEVGFVDEDDDGAPDSCELGSFCLDAGNPNDGGQDFDGDGILSAQECLIGNDPCVSNAPAPAPSVHLPVDGDIVREAEVSLVVNNSADPDGDPLQYIFELYRGAELVDLVELITADETPDRTAGLVTEELEENGFYCWRAFATDGPGRSGFSSVACFVFSLVNDPPSAPVAIEPVGLTRTRRPEFIWANSVEPERQGLSYRLEVLNEADEIVFEADDIEQGEGERTSFEDITVGLLSDNTTYRWRVEATDEEGASSSSETLEFFVNLQDQRPGPVAFIEPEDGALIEDLTQVQIATTEADDPDGDPLVYDFRVGRDESMVDVLVTFEGLEAQEGVVAFEADLSGVGLEENDRFVIEARARDDRGPGPAVFVALLFSAVNEGPGAPTLQSPVDVTVSTSTPELVWRNVTDPEGDAITFTVQMARDEAMTDLIFEASEIAAGEGDETVFEGVEALSDDTPIFWQVFGTDALGADGASSEVARFVVNIKDDRPSAPVLISPINEEALESGVGVVFVWEKGVDPEGDAISYELSVFDANGAQVGEDVEFAEEPEGPTSSGVFPGELGPGTYSWRVRSKAGGQASEFSDSAFFVVKDPPVVEPEPEDCEDFERLGLDLPDECIVVDVTPPKGGCDCQQLPSAPTSPAPLALTLLALIGVAVVRRRRPEASLPRS